MPDLSEYVPRMGFKNNHNTKSDEDSGRLQCRELCLKVRTPKNWRVHVTTLASTPRTPIPAIIVTGRNGKIILRMSENWKEKRNAQKHETKENLHAYTSFPYGCWEEREALVRSARIGRDDSDTNERVDMVLGQNISPPARRPLSVRQQTPTGMGSNVSRHTDKGMGRRATSSGNLCHGAKLLGPSVGRFFSPCGTGSVSPRDRNKLCGSLPTHLDEKGVRRGPGTPESLYGRNNNYGDIYGLGPLRADDADVQLLLCKPAPHSAADEGYSAEDGDRDVSPVDPTQRAPTSHPFLSDFPFITKDRIFEVVIEKGSRGLGLSVTGGVDSDDPDAGLLRIKRVFPHEPAWQSGALLPQDILLHANGTPLTGLTNYEALEVLRSTSNPVHLVVCRVVAESAPGDAPNDEPPSLPVPAASHRPHSSHPLRISPVHNLSFDTCGEFDIILQKVNGSLGFTLRKEDESVLGHYVRALVREPALSDGRIRPGDKIVAVNGMDISPLSHEDAVQMLRRCGNTVSLRLYRDSAQTPVAALSPTEPCERRLALRQEAVEMLTHLAVKRQSPGESSPRRRRLDRTDHSRTHASTEQSKKERPRFLDLDKESLGCYKLLITNSSDEPASLPAMSTSDFNSHNPLYQSDHSPGFSTHNPLYQSTRAPSPSPLPSPATTITNHGPQGLLKWKGVVFTPGQEADDALDSTPILSDFSTTEEGELLIVELSKGWNSRLGFSLQGSGTGTYISAIYADSVAAKDGRLQIGDKVLMINDEKIEEMPTSDVIDLLRKIRGAIAITVLRKRSSRPATPASLLP